MRNTDTQESFTRKLVETHRRVKLEENALMLGDERVESGVVHLRHEC